MSQQHKSWLEQCLLSLGSTSKQIFQSVSGNRNQIIGQMFGGTVISNVEKLTLSPQEVLSLDHFWQNWSQDTNPAFSPSLVIGGREGMQDRILSWLRGSPSPFTLQGNSPEETIAFLAAVIQSLETEERTKVLSRAVVVNSATSWQSLITSSDPRILIARLKEPEGIGRAIQLGHHVFVPSGRVSSDIKNLLPRIVRDAAEQALKEMNLSKNEPYRLATLARRSLSALRRKLAIAQNIQQPDWAKPTEARVLLAPLLVSAWNDTCEGDRAALAKLSGISYETLQTHLVRWAKESDPPLRRIGDIWMISSQEDAWRLISQYLTNDDLNRFQEVALDVLSELDPAFELPPEQRYAAAVYRKVLSRSNYLREGISEMLALMATLSSETSFIANQTGEAVAAQVVWQLMEKAKDSATLWASLAYKLPLLAEATPGIFLDAIDMGLTGENPILVSLFQDKTSYTAFTSSSPHTGLLWALETLAWNPDYLGKAALNLARLTRLDPGGSLGNRPIKSLRDIFICWHPNTTASLPNCLRVLDTIRKHEPDVAWNLLMSLLPQSHSTVSPTHGTKWRDWVPDPRIPITVQEYDETTDEILKRLISDADSNITRWINLVVSARGMDIHQQKILLNSLEALDFKQFSSEDRVQMSDCLRNEIIDHYNFSEAKWAMPIEHVQILEAVMARFEPDNLTDRHRWLFKHAVKIRGNRNIEWNEMHRIVGDLRTEALQEIMNSHSWIGVTQLAKQAQEPSLVGITLAKADLLPMDISSFLQDNLLSDDPSQSELARSYVTAQAYGKGDGWIKECLNTNSSTWSAEKYGEFLLCLPFNTHLSNCLYTSTQETQSYYWKRARAECISFLDIDNADRVLSHLLESGRPHLAINRIEWELKQTPNLFSPEQIAEVLEVAARNTPDQNLDFGSFAYNSAELMNYLEKTEISRDRLASLELMYFRLHEHYRRPNILFDKMAKNPEMFVEALQYVFSAENEPVNEDLDEQDTPSLGAAEFAWHLLEKWKQMPGVLEDRSVNAEALRSWVMKARELSAKCGRGKIADSYIGHSLAFSPADPDGNWPHQAVRDLIEELANPTIENGLFTQILNNRGITTRLPTDGGKQEQTLTYKFEGYARQISYQWSRTSAVLRNIADHYRQESSRQDIRAELTQDLWR